MSLNIFEEEQIVCKDVIGPPWFVDSRTLVATVIFETIACRTHPMLPRKLDMIYKKVCKIYEKHFYKASNSFYIKRFDSYAELYNFLHQSLLMIPEIKELQLSENEYNRRTGLHDSDYVPPKRREPLINPDFPDPLIDEKDDFINLKSLIKNICYDLILQEQRIDVSSLM